MWSRFEGTPRHAVAARNGVQTGLPDGVNLSFTRSYDSMGRQNGMTTTRIVDENWQTDTIVDNVTYGPANEMTQIRVNGVNETRAYNTLGQLTGISYGGTLRHEYRYSASANDGRAVSYKNWQSGEDVQYTYDSLARLTKAETLGPDWGQSFGYDGWGNLLSKSVTKGSAPVMSVTADPATNRLVVSGMAYDANGNVTSMPGVGTLTYDARNRITGSGGVPTRGYDPGNRKIWWKDANGITFVDYWLPNGEKLVTYKIDEAPYVNDQRYPGPVQFLTVTRTLYFAGRQVKVEGRYGVGGYVEWPQPDRLSSNARHHPYGEERGTSSTEYKFATYQREASGLDYALNRYYSSVYGRFLSSDPYRASGGPSDPGSWNRYAYVQGDPVNRNDSEGLQDNCVDMQFDIETLHGHGAIWCIPKARVPVNANYSAKQRDALQSGFEYAIMSATHKFDCLSFFGGDAAARAGLEMTSWSGMAVAQKEVWDWFSKTDYRIVALPSKGAAAATASPSSVFLNPEGAFFNVEPAEDGFVRVSIPGPEGVGFERLKMTEVAFRGFVLLHEFGHQTGKFGTDTDPVQNRNNSLSVLNNCLQKWADGAYH